MTLAVHGPGLFSAPGGDGWARLRLPCCGVHPLNATPGLVTTDVDLVTCGRLLLDVELHLERDVNTWPTNQFAVFLGEWAGPFAVTPEYVAPGSWLTLDGGTLDIGVIRDVMHFYGARWRPWKRLLHRRLGPLRVPRCVQRWFGWRPQLDELRIFAEEFAGTHFVRDDTASNP